MLKSVASLMLSIIIFITSLFFPSVPAQKTTEELMKTPPFFEKFELGDELYVINVGSLKTNDEFHVAACLQGLVAKVNPCIYINCNQMYSSYLNEIENKGVKVIYNDEDGNRWTLESLIKKFQPYIKDNGYVLYRPTDKAEGLNMATNLSTLKGWLALPESLSYIADNLGLVLKEDFSDDKYNVFFQWKFFNKYKDQFNMTAVVHEMYDMKGLRDLAIQQGFFTFYIDDDEDGVWFRKLVLNYAKSNCLVLGWGKHEVEHVKNASYSGDMVIPSDHCYNNSYLTSFTCNLPDQKRTETKVYDDPSKHYCAILFSDGDNVQWVQNGFSEFYQRQKLETSFPMTWTFPTLLQEISPLTYNKVLNDSTENDYFIAGVSGAGYIHPTEYPFAALSEFTDITASQMLKSDIEYVTILDSVPKNIFEEIKLTNSLEYYARYDNIKGGIIYFDPGRYAGGNGRIFFVNDKPFLSARFSLWYPSGQMNEVTKEWIDEQAAIINNYEADINSINGYSVINIHPWSISIENLEYFVNQLDEHIELVTVDELLETIGRNVPHQNAEVNANV